MQNIKIDLTREGPKNVFFTGDTHFGHENIIKYSNRPFDTVAEMNEKMIENWNEVVGPKDTVFHLGDFFFAQGSGREKMAEDSWRRNIISRLNGHIQLVRGNHDEHLNDKLFKGRIHDTYRVRIISEFFGERIDSRFFLFHYAMRTWPGKHKEAIHLYGHSHGKVPGLGRSMDVGVDCHADYRPFSLEEVLERMFPDWFKSKR